ncbi:SIS domain-containing protein [candidate division WOR-3 bacterium]|nr:SIS domain-containing protein [candidate division WOR-3 bacterium]
MHIFAQNYYRKLSDLFNSIRTTNKHGGELNFFDAIEKVCDLIILKTAAGHKLMFIGNGASAAISSHMSTDFWKNGGMRAIAFNDSSLLTCLGNDYGYEYIFEKSVEMFADEGDILVAISSSGKSENILRGAHSAKSNGCGVVTLSGFESGNPLSLLGDFNFYVPDKSYGPVEIIHQSICHCILDAIVQENTK